MNCKERNDSLKIAQIYEIEILIVFFVISL